MSDPVNSDVGQASSRSPLNSDVGQASSLSPHNASFHAIGVDVGGTKIAAGIAVFPEGKVVTRRLIPTLPNRGGEAVLADVEQLVSELATAARATALPVGGIGVGLCEIVDRDGKVRSAHCVDWRDRPVRERLSTMAPALIEADVRAAALAEALFGAGRDAGVTLYISIGTGISSCLVIDGSPFRGARGGSGAMASGLLPGFTEVRGDSMPVTLEQIASGPALVARFRLMGGAASSGQEVLAAAGAGDAQAAHIVRSAAAALGGSIGWLINVLDPERVILGGGLGLVEGLYRDELIQSARRHIWWEDHRNLPIVPAATGSDAGVLGAAAAAWKQFSPE